MKTNLKLYLKAITLLIIIICLSVSSKGVISSAKSALDTCLYVLLPSLFPFFVLSRMLILSGGSSVIGRAMNFIMKPLFRINGNGATAFILGIISGYPVGAKTASELYNQKLITKAEAENLTCFCNNSGPLFIIGAVGTGMFLNQKIGLFLYIIHVLASITTGILLRFIIRDKSKSKQSFTFKENKNVFTSSVESSVVTILNIFGYVIFFAVIMQLLKEYKIIDTITGFLSYINLPADAVNACICGLFEITTSIKKLSEASGLTLNFKIILTSFILGWAGFSVHFQVKSIIKGLSFFKYVLGKMLHSIIALLYACIGVMFLKLDTETAITSSKVLDFSRSYNIFTIVSVIILIIYFICSRYKKKSLIQTRI